ncbi:unnamed protein product, partial [Dracunculus medinensis]|uniref:Translocon-associated protein subunit delta n=1 Tax=Dracunculus medinensis TaxID=318479 RepID=A0A0N4U441_DRAME
KISSFYFISATKCDYPKYSSATFSTTDAFFHFSTTYIVEFNLQCANNPKDMMLYGIINGKTYQIAMSEETAKHQISWQLEHDQSGAQTFNIYIYDEDGFSAYRKGVSKASPVASETVVTLLAFIVLYFAYNYKSQLIV